MKGLKILIPVTMIFLLSLLQNSQAFFKCCHISYPVCNLCEDCTRGTPYCGVGPCNFLGCGCGAGCRTGACGIERCTPVRGKRAILEDADMYKNVSQVIEFADRNFDGKLDLAEAIGFLKLKNPAHLEEIDIEKAFRGLDKNGDAFLSSSEIDQP